MLVSVYMRTSPESLADLPSIPSNRRSAPPPPPQAAKSASATNVALQDVFLGVIKIRPLFVDQKVQDEWYPLAGGSGHMRVQMCFKVPPAADAPLTIDSFELLTVVGKGSFGKVILD